MKKVIFILFFILPVILLSEILFSGKCFFIRDLLGQFHPWKTFIREELISGRFPLYNPYNFCGSPLFSNLQSGVLYPLGIIFNLFSFARAYKAYIYLHLALSGIFSFLLLKKNGFSNLASLFGGILFTFNSAFLTQFEFLSGIGSFIWLYPVLLFSGTGTKCGQSPFLALSISFCFLAGQSQILFLWLLFLIFYIFFLRKKNDKFPDNKAASAFLIFVLSSGTAVLISAIQLLPSAEYFIESSRALYTLKDFTVNSLRIDELLRFVKPFYGVGGNPALPVEIRLFLENYWVKTFYTGWVAALAAVAGLFFLKKKSPLFLVFIIAVIFIALGENSPGSGLIPDKIYSLLGIRYPARYMLLVLIAVIFLSVSGIENIRKLLNNRFKAGEIISVLLCLLVFFQLVSAGKKMNPAFRKDIFTATSAKINFLKNSGGGRFFLSMKTEGEAGGYDFLEIKDLLYSNINLPFRIYNAYGRDIMPAGIYRLVNEMAQLKSADLAAETLSKMNVRYLIITNTGGLKNFRELLSGERVSIYENLKYRREMETAIISLPGKIRIKQKRNGDSSPEMGTVPVSSVRLSEIYNPGWHIYIDGKKGLVSKDSDGFMTIPLSGKRNKILLRYMPRTFILGTGITVLMLLFILTGMLRHLPRYRQG